MTEFVPGDFAALRGPWNAILGIARGRLLFSSPDWCEVWWKHFGAGSELHLGTVKEDGRLIGIAPMRIKDRIACFVGSDNVCDFIDFVVEDGKETVFFQALADHLRDISVDSLDLSPMLPDSSAMRFLPDQMRLEGWSVSSEQQDVTVALDLPRDVAAYHALLSAKQRHELLRKDRRLNEEGQVLFEIHNQADERDVELFLRFFRESREDKNQFLTREMEGFFKTVMDRASSVGILELGLLGINGVTVAVTFGFKYGDTTYLYNSGYDPRYREMSVGVLSKYYHIRHSIGEGRKRFDFLKGSERYKFHLGGTETPVFRCIIKRY